MIHWFRRWRHIPALSTAQREQIAQYDALEACPLDTEFSELPLLVADVETTGLNPHRDRLISIGALSIVKSDIQLDKEFSVFLRQPEASHADNILIHGIDGSTQRNGREPVEALLDFLAYAGKSCIVGFHADFDRVVINRACREHLGMEPANRWLDLAYLAPAVCLSPDERHAPEGLDAWLQRYQIDNFSRHSAIADALATAQLLLVVLAQAQQRGYRRVDQLVELEKAQRWLRHS